MILSTDGVHPYGSFWLDFADKFIKAAAVLVGGAWTYINFQRSRTFQRKLELSLSGEFFEQDGEHYLLVTTSIKNVGQSHCSIAQEGMGIEALSLSTKGREQIGVAVVFADHALLEPGETIQDAAVMPIPPPTSFVAIRLTLRVVSKIPEPLEWNCSRIVTQVVSKKISTFGE
jgi:hypothetical protein